MPVLASSRGGTPELVDHDVTGLLFDPAEPRGLEAALARIAADRAILGRWSEAALERTRRRAASPVGEAYVELFKELTRS